MLVSQSRPIRTALACVLVLGATCGYAPVQPDDRVLEMERVWQYITVFSLYHDRAPDHAYALALDNPSQLVGLLDDTLHSPFDSVRNIASYDLACDAETRFAQNAAFHEQGKTVRYARLTDSTAYIAIDLFRSGTADELLALESSIESARNIILDLRNNPGGNLDACTASVELFLPRGARYMTTRYRRNMLEDGDSGTVTATWEAKRGNPAWENKRLAILINRNTASAAEIMASALRSGLDQRATLIGDTTYGKAIGQYVFCFSATSKAQLTLTGFRFYALSSPDYHERGIAPDRVDTSQTIRYNALIFLEPGVNQPDIFDRVVWRTLAKEAPGGCNAYVPTGGTLLF